MFPALFPFDLISNRLFRGLKVDPAILDHASTVKKAVGEGKHVVYVLRRPSFLEGALLRNWCIANGLPLARQTLSQAHVNDQLPPASLLFLRGRTGAELTIGLSRGIRRQLKKKLLLWQREKNRPDTVFVPISFIEGKGPRPWPMRHTSPIDFPWLPTGDIWLSFVFLFHRDSLRFELGPVMEPSPNEKPGQLIRALSRELYWQEKRARGAKHHSKETLESIVLSGNDFEETLERLAISSSTSLSVIHYQARSILREISATINPRVIAILGKIINKTYKKLFADIEVMGLERLRRCSKHPVILLPSHRSHFDYILLSWLFYEKDMPIPHIAAGNNLNFFPVGKLLRAGGAFFIRRKIDNDYLYKSVLERYLRYLVKQGHSIEFFIEGGRSRSGQILAPRLGLLKALVRSLQKGDRRDIMLAPVAITYDHIAEAKSLSSEQRGKKKRNESIWELLKARLIFSRRFGSVVVNVGTPFSLKEFSEQPRTKSSAARNNLSLLTEDLGFAIARDIVDSTAITSSALVASALISTKNMSASEEALAVRMRKLLGLIAVSKGETKADFDKLEDCIVSSPEERRFAGVALSNILASALESEYGLGDLASTVQSIGLITVEGEEEPIYSVSSDQLLPLAIHKNNIVHLFIPSVFVYLAHTCEKEEFETRLNLLHQLFKPSLLLPHWDDWKTQAFTVKENLQKAGLIGEDNSQEASAEMDSIMGVAAPLLLHYFDATNMALDLFEEKAENPIPPAEFRREIRYRIQLDPLNMIEASTSSCISFAEKCLSQLEISKPKYLEEEKKRVLGPGSRVESVDSDSVNYTTEASKDINFLRYCRAQIHKLRANETR